MKAKHIFYSGCLAALVLAAPMAQANPWRDNDQISAFTALQLVSDRFGPMAIDSIVEIRGRQGQSQPESWNLIVYDRRAPFLMKSFEIDGRRTSDEGPYDEFYPDFVPDGFVKRSKLQVDSTAAFRILEQEASHAGVGFDSISYLLRSREFSDEPLWRFTAKDVDGYTVGKIDLSGSTGAILRSVWIFWDERHRDAPRIVDSALLGGPSIPTAQPPAELGQAFDEPPAASPYPPRAAGVAAGAAVDVAPPSRNLTQYVPPGPPMAEVEPLSPKNASDASQGDEAANVSPVVRPGTQTGDVAGPAVPPPPAPVGEVVPPAPPRVYQTPPETSANIPMPPEIPADLAGRRRGPVADSAEGNDQRDADRTLGDSERGGAQPPRVINDPDSDPVIVVPLGSE